MTEGGEDQTTTTSGEDGRAMPTKEIVSLDRFSSLFRPKRVKRVVIDADVIVAMLRGKTMMTDAHGDAFVTMTGIPADAEAVGVAVDFIRPHQVSIALQSESFDPILEGSHVPVIALTAVWAARPTPQYRLHERNDYLVIERVSDGKCWITEIDDLDDPRLYTGAVSLGEAESEIAVRKGEERDASFGDDQY